MKNLFRFLCLCLLLLLPFGSFAQEAYKGELFVTRQQFSLLNGGQQLQVDLGIDYEGLRTPSDESITVTPILQAGEQKLVLPSVVINGLQKQKVYNRKSVLTRSKTSKPGYKVASSPAVVLRNDAKKSRSFSYKVAIPYSDWMKDAILTLRSEECNCNGKTGKVYEDKIADGIRFPQPKTSPRDNGIDTRFLALVNFLTPAPEKDSVNALYGSIPYTTVESENGKTLARLSQEKQNVEIYYRLRDAVRTVQQDMGTEVTSVTLTGVGTPLGNIRKNERDGLARSLNLKDYLRENRVTRNAPLTVNWVAEDWDSIATLVRSSDMMFREATLDIINNVDVDKGRERMLQELADGKPYRYLVDKIFPAVRRIDYKIAYTRRQLDAAESRKLFQTNSRALNLSEFFAVANSYPSGSMEYNDALDLAARLFPDSPEANINAAAVALTKKDTVRARHYLSRFATLPMAYNNMGILCLLEGNRDKAEVYLQMAAANGVEQAKEALTELPRN